MIDIKKKFQKYYTKKGTVDTGYNLLENVKITPLLNILSQRAGF